MDDCLQQSLYSTVQEHGWVIAFSTLRDKAKKRSAFGILLLLCEVDSLTAPVKLRCTLQQVRGRTLGHVWLVDFSKKKGNQALFGLSET